MHVWFRIHEDGWRWSLTRPGDGRELAVSPSGYESRGEALRAFELVTGAGRCTAEGSGPDHFVRYLHEPTPEAEAQVITAEGL